MKKHKRTDNEIKIDHTNAMQEMAERTPREIARRHMQHRPYTVFGYLRKMGVDTKGEISCGQGDSGRV